MTKTNPAVDRYFAKLEKWEEELKTLRRIALGCSLTEELKWGKPFYTFQESNVAVLWGFKDHCALGFCKGALLQDPDGILSPIGENTQAARKVKFNGVGEIVALAPALKAYLREAIEAQKAGLEVKYKETSEFPIPEEVRMLFSENPVLKAAFERLTPGRQRGYLLHFAAAKQPQTRRARAEKCAPLIMSGKGLNDRPGRGA